MYKIYIKMQKEPIEIIDDKRGLNILTQWRDETVSSDTKFNIENWTGFKNDIRSVYHVKEESNAFSASQDIKFSDNELIIFWKTILPFTEKRAVPFSDDGSTFDYLTREGEVLFLETHNVLIIEDRSKLLQYRITNPNGFLGLRDKIGQVHRMHGRYEMAQKNKLKQLDSMAENIGVLPK